MPAWSTSRNSLQPRGRSDRIADQEPQRQREDDVFNAPVDERAVAGDEARKPRQRKHHGEADDEGHHASAEQGDAHRGENQVDDADGHDLLQVRPRQHSCFSNRACMSANFGSERAGDRPAAELRQLPGGRLDRLAVILLERLLERRAEGHHVLLALGLGFLGDAVQRRNPPRGTGRDLLVRGPPESGHCVAQVDRLRVEEGENHHDDEEPQEYGHPVFCAPAPSSHDRPSLCMLIARMIPTVDPNSP
jgi:hypothetical protein